MVPNSFRMLAKKVNLPTALPNFSRGGRQKRPLLFHHCAQWDCALGKQQPRKTRFCQQQSGGDEETSLRGQQSHPLPKNSVNGHKQRHQPWNAIWRSMRMHFVRQRRREEKKNEKHKRFRKFYTLSWFLSVETHPLKDQNRPEILHCHIFYCTFKKTHLHLKNVLIRTKTCFWGLSFDWRRQI